MLDLIKFQNKEVIFIRFKYDKAQVPIPHKQDCIPAPDREIALANNTNSWYL
jgi:hypothetical protein